MVIYDNAAPPVPLHIPLADTFGSWTAIWNILMLDVHIVAAVNRRLYEPIMAQYHRCRHDVFVEEMGWSNLQCRDGSEFDQFDDRHAVYLIAIDDGHVVGGQRFYPTERPHMLSEVFPHLVQWPLPRGPETWECTRYFIARERRGGRAEARLMVAIQQFCVEEGITHCTGVAELANLSRRLQAGIQFRPLGLPQNVGGQPTVAVVAEITMESLKDSMRRLGVRHAPLVRRGIDVGWIGDRHEEVALSA